MKFVIVPAEKTDVFLIDVNIHEAAHLAGIVAQMLADRGEALLDFAEQVRQRFRSAFDGLNAVGESPQR
jgi:hypothetical protein